MFQWKGFACLSLVHWYKEMTLRHLWECSRMLNRAIGERWLFFFFYQWMSVCKVEKSGNAIWQNHSNFHTQSCASRSPDAVLIHTTFSYCMPLTHVHVAFNDCDENLLVQRLHFTSLYCKWNLTNLKNYTAFTYFALWVVVHVFFSPPHCKAYH